MNLKTCVLSLTALGIFLFFFLPLLYHSVANLSVMKVTPQNRVVLYVIRIRFRLNSRIVFLSGFFNSPQHLSIIF